MAKINTLFLTKTAEKTYPLGRTHLYSPYKGIPPTRSLPGEISLLWQAGHDMN